MAPPKTGSSAKSFKRLVRGSLVDKKKKKTPTRYRRSRLMAALKKVDGLRVRLPEFGRVAEAFEQVDGTIFPEYFFKSTNEFGKQTTSSLHWDAKSCAERLFRLIGLAGKEFNARCFKMRKFAAKDRVVKAAKENYGVDFGPFDSLSSVILLETNADRLQNRLVKFYEENFNVIAVNADGILYSEGVVSGRIDFPRLSPQNACDYFAEAKNSSLIVTESVLYRRIFALHLILHDIITWMSCEIGFDKRFAECVGVHKPVFVIYPRSLSFVFDFINTLPLSILRTHRRCVFLSQ